ncbi:MAG: extracellular solute-binding protein [Oscillospiraceae bacterium]|jgi:arabinogalactan oligomer/maltooligosaccharide transport system substrate-binding protein|nr:extracellular solute-binding protein [Oscillospiraceae bacterium]
MKRFWPALLAAALLLAACSGVSPGEPSPSASADPDEPVLTKRNIELTVWERPGAGEEFIRQAAAVFNQKYPNIVIRCVGVEPGDIPGRVRDESERGGCADLFLIPHTEIRALADALLILPARDQTKTKAAVFPVCAQAASAGGAVFGYPVSAETVALFYNKRLFAEDEPPASWEELVALAKGLNNGEQAGFVMPAGSVYYAFPFALTWNARPFGPDGGDPDAFDFENVTTVEGMKVFKSLRAVSLPSEELSPGAAARAFASGKAAFCVAGLWDVRQFTEAGVSFGVAPLPAFPGGDHPSASFASVGVMTVSAYSANPDEASAFAALLLTEEMQKLRVELTGELPSSDITLRAPAYADGFMRQMEHAVPYPAFLPSSDFGRALAVFEEAAARIWDGADIGAELAACSAARRPPERDG